MKHIIFTAAAVVGLFLRTFLSALKGWEYSINGADIIVAVAALAAAVSLYSLLRPAKKPQRKSRRR